MTGNWWPPGDESGWEHYHPQMYDVAQAENDFIRWKMLSSGVNTARQVASARNGALKGWMRQYGEDPSSWPLAHPPAVLWQPSVARAGCLRCWWLDPSCSTADGAAASARRHCFEHLQADVVGLDLVLAPLRVWQSYAERDDTAPRYAG